ncbi:hypothetical protein GCM10028777_27890 [Angustibacter speluncae]
MDAPDPEVMLEAGRRLVRGLRNRARARAADDAQMLVQVRLLAQTSRYRNRHRLGEVLVSRRTVTGNLQLTEPDLDDLGAREVAAALAITLHEAHQLLRVADVLTTTLTRTAAALAAGRVDLRRVQALVRGVDGLPEAAVLKVEKRVLDLADDAESPWDDVTARGFADRVRRAVADVVQQDLVELERDLRERTGTWLQVDVGNPALATFTVTGPTAQLAPLAEAVAAGARRVATGERDGRTVGQVEVDVLVAAVVHDVPPGPGGARRELGVVLHVDTLVEDGPAAHAAGQVRGTGTGGVLHASAAATRLAADGLQAGSATTCVLVADDDGHLDRVLRVGPAPSGGWTRETLVTAARTALRRPGRRVAAGRHDACDEVVASVRARDPVCTFPGCGVPASRCDLDHDEPWPRGPTTPENLTPRSRRCHRYKTAALWRSRTRLDACGHVVAHEWTSPLGTRQVVEVPALPGYGPGEAYGSMPMPPRRSQASI